MFGSCFGRNLADIQASSFMHYLLVCQCTPRVQIMALNHGTALVSRSSMTGTGSATGYLVACLLSARACNSGGSPGNSILLQADIPPETSEHVAPLNVGIRFFLQRQHPFPGLQLRGVSPVF